MKNWKEEKNFGRVIGVSCRAGVLKVSVHRYIGHPADQWFVSCSPFFEVKPLESKDMEEARCQATEMVKVKLEEAIAIIAA